MSIRVPIGNFFSGIDRASMPEALPKIPLHVEGIGDIFNVLNITMPDQSDTTKTLVRYTQQKMIEHIISVGEPFTVNCIFGEVKELTAIKMILENPDANKLCKSIHLIFGDKIWDSERRTELCALLEKYKGKFFAYRHFIRPENHGIMIADKIMLESKHGISEKYEELQIIDNTTPDARRIFMNEFNRLLADSIEQTPATCRGLELYNNN